MSGRTSPQKRVKEVERTSNKRWRHLLYRASATMRSSADIEAIVAFKPCLSLYHIVCQLSGVENRSMYCGSVDLIEMFMRSSNKFWDADKQASLEYLGHSPGILDGRLGRQEN